MCQRGEGLRYMTLWNIRKKSITTLLIGLFLVGPWPLMAELIPQADLANSKPDLLEKGKTIGKALKVGEVHSYALKMDSDQAAIIILERQGVAAVATFFGPDGRKAGSFGRIAGRGIEKINFIAESTGEYRIDIQTLFKPSPPARYELTLTDIHMASDLEKSDRAEQSCKEKSWLDPEKNFLVNEAMDSLSRCIGAVGKRLQGNHPEAAGLAAEAAAELNYLKGRWRWGEVITTAYKESLLDDFRAAAKAATDTDPNRAAEVVKRLVEDIKIKAEHCRSSNQGLGPPILVTVETRKGQKEEKGWYVFYKCGLYQDIKGFARRFPEESSPTSKEMAPSRYFFWIAAKDDAPEPPQNKQKEIIIGKGMDKHRLHLSVP